jgi:hypothetical protein
MDNAYGDEGKVMHKIPPEQWWQIWKWSTDAKAATGTPTAGVIGLSMRAVYHKWKGRAVRR